MANERLVYISLNDSKFGGLHPMYKNNPRSDEPVDQALKNSIKEHGILTPLFAIPFKADKTIRIIAGQRRLKALQALAAEGVEVEAFPVLVRQLDEGEAWAQHMIENNLRRANSPLTIAAEVAACVKMGQSFEAIAGNIGTSHQTARNYANLHSMPDFIKAAVEKGELSPTAAFQLQTSAYRKEGGDGNAVWDEKKLKEALGKMREKAAAKGEGKVKVATAKEGKTDELPKISYDALRKIASRESTPELFALVFNAITGAASIESVREAADGELDWFTLPVKEAKPKAEKKAKAAKPAKPAPASATATAPTKGKTAKAKAAVEEASIEPTTIDDDDMDALFGE